jgi:hypothetical protein
MSMVWVAVGAVGGESTGKVFRDEGFDVLPLVPVGTTAQMLNRPPPGRTVQVRVQVAFHR